MAEDNVTLSIEREDSRVELEVGDICEVRTDVLHEYPQQMATPYVTLSLLVIEIRDNNVICIDEGPILHRLEQEDGSITSHSTRWDNKKAKITEIEFKGRESDNEVQRALDNIDDEEIEELF